VIHSQECIDKQAALQKAIADWKQRWPNHCDNCLGAGAFVVPGDWWTPDMQEPCGVCSDQGRCARCGEEGLTSEERGDVTTGEGPCRSCSWNYDDECPSIDGPCACELAEEDESAEPAHSGTPQGEA